VLSVDELSRLQALSKRVEAEGKADDGKVAQETEFLPGADS